jgi:hypothetical protein
MVFNLLRVPSFSNPIRHEGPNLICFKTVRGGMKPSAATLQAFPNYVNRYRDSSNYFTQIPYDLFLRQPRFVKFQTSAKSAFSMDLRVICLSILSFNGQEKKFPRESRAKYTYLG